MTFRIAALLLCLSIPGTAHENQNNIDHDAAFWRGIIESGYEVPAGESPARLIDELITYLGSPDPEFRDVFAYSITARWAYRDERLTQAELQSLVAKLAANLTVGRGETGNDGVLLRSFSALDLSLLAALDAKKPFLTDAGFATLLTNSLDYLAEEKDVRGYDEKVGWRHSTAHTADLLKFLARNDRLRVADQNRILTTIADKLASAGVVYTWGEDERLARTIISLISREDFDADAFDVWLDGFVADAKKVWSGIEIDSPRFVASQNGKNLLRSLHVALCLAKEPPERAVLARAQVLATLAKM